MRYRIKSLEVQLQQQWQLSESEATLPVITPVQHTPTPAAPVASTSVTATPVASGAAQPAARLGHQLESPFQSPTQSASLSHQSVQPGSSANYATAKKQQQAESESSAMAGRQLQTGSDGSASSAMAQLHQIAQAAQEGSQAPASQPQQPVTQPRQDQVSARSQTGPAVAPSQPKTVAAVVGTEVLQPGTGRTSIPALAARDSSVQELPLTEQQSAEASAQQGVAVPEDLPPRSAGTSPTQPVATASSSSPSHDLSSVGPAAAAAVNGSKASVSNTPNHTS